MKLRYKFVLPINFVIVLVLGASLAWERERSRAEELGERKTRLDEEVRFLRAAYRTLGVSPRFAEFLDGFCRGADPASAPEHQVAIVEGGAVVAASAAGAGHRLDPIRLAGLGPGFWTRHERGGPYLVRVADDGSRRVVVAESLRAVRGLVLANLWNQVGWYLGLGVLLLVAVNVVMGRVVLRPIGRLSRAVREVEQGRLGVEVESPNGDELGALGRRFNAMSRAIAEQVEADRRELETARRVQMHLLPPPHFRLGCLEVAGRCLSSGPVGGDVYDVQPLHDGRVGLLVADLSGHNVAAALHTAMVRAIVWREAEQAASPGEVMARLNERLCRDLPDEHFATAFFGWFDPRTGRLHYASAGHPPAYVRSPAGAIRGLEPTGPLLGIFPDLPHECASTPVDAGSLLLVYTDGVTEAQDGREVLWGTEEMLSLLGSADETAPGDAVERILDRMGAFRGPCPQQDDVTLVLARYEPKAVQAPRQVLGPGPIPVGACDRPRPDAHASAETSGPPA